MSWMDLLAVGMARWFLWACPNQYTNREFWEIYADAQAVYRAYCAYEDDQLRKLGALNIHEGGPAEYEP